MADLSDFPITRRWPPTRPDVIQLYSLNTPNGVKASIMLEETGLAYEPHLIDIMKDENKTDEFVSLNPNARIPLPEMAFPGAAHHTTRDGRIVTGMPRFFPLGSQTIMLLPTDDQAQVDAR